MLAKRLMILIVCSAFTASCANGWTMDRNALDRVEWLSFRDQRRTAVAAQRTDGTPVWLRADTAAWFARGIQPGPRVPVRRRGHPGYLTGGVLLLTVGLGIATGGAVFLGAARCDPRSGYCFDEVFTALGGSLLGAGALVMIGGIPLLVVGNRMQPQEVDGGRSDLTYLP
jgi:hypothetical protein